MNKFAVKLYNDMMLSIKQGNGVNGKSIAKPLLLLSIVDAVSDKKRNSINILCNDNLKTGC